MTAPGLPQGICVRACSACSGDYEDPERSAWSETIEPDGDQPTEEEGGENAGTGSAEQSASREGFPAQEK
jgi:hypothetical protein